MPTFTPPIGEGYAWGDPSSLDPVDRLMSFYGAVPTGETVWKDQSGTFHKSQYPFLGDQEFRTFVDGELVSSIVGAPGLLDATEVYLGGHTYEVTEAKRTELVAAGFFVGGHWDSEEDKWITFATNSTVNRGFKAGDATASIFDPSGGLSLWSHADTLIGDVDSEGSIIINGLVKNSCVIRAHPSGTLDGQIFGGAGTSPAWKHPSHPSIGFTPMDMVYNSAGQNPTDIVVIGWAEPTSFDTPFQEGLVMQLAGFGSAGTFHSYSMVNGKFGITSVFTDTNFHYILGREPDITLMLPGGFTPGAPFNNNAQKNWIHLGRAPIGQLTNPSSWEYWSGTAWNSSSTVLTEHSRLRDNQNNTLDGLVDLTKVGDEYVLILIHPSSPTVWCYKSSTITGPWDLYHLADNPDRIPDGGSHPPSGLRYWSGFPKFHEYLNPDSLTLLISHSHGVYNPVIGAPQGPLHISQGIPNFVFLPTPEAMT